MAKFIDETGLAHLIKKNDARYVRQEEGKGLSTNDFSDEYKKIVDDLNYVKIAINSMTATNQANEIGSTVTATTVNWTTNKTPKTLKIKFGSEVEENLDVSLKTKAFSGKSVKSNTNILLTATDERKATATKQVTISFQPKVYWGVADGSNYDDAVLLGLGNGALSGSKGRTFSANAGGGQYIVYAIPSSFGTPTFNVGGFDGGFKKVKTFSHTNASGYAQNYDVWQSVNAGLGQTTVVVK